MRPILWGVDVQADFMLPGGKLYVPDAEKIIPNINRLVDQVRRGRTLLISSSDAHAPNDPEFRQWPPHCVKGTPGAELIPEGCSTRLLVVPNEPDFAFPKDLSAHQQILLEKNTLDVFDNPNTDRLLSWLNALEEADAQPHFFVFGVVTEYCVFRAADGLLRRGHRISIIEDAIQSLNGKKAGAIVEELQARGADLVFTDHALALLKGNLTRPTEGELRRTAGN